MKPFYLTTAIDYANGSPHIGHAYEKVLADVVARTLRLSGGEVYFRTGLDEHGTKVQKAAEARGVEPQAICDAIADEFQALLRTLHISNDDYIRTTEPRHKNTVRTFLQKLYDKKIIIKGEYRGYYSPRQEQFLLEKDKVDGKWPEIYGEVIELVEPNYFFPLEPHREWLQGFLKDHPDWICPLHRQRQVVEFLKNPLNDLCISRPRERLAWGIPLPFDQAYVTYVWFDALVNYITPALGDSAARVAQWPADIHIIGKDILVPPHAVYWPIMLHAAGFADAELPKHLLVHGFWLVGGKKESKSDIEKAKAAGEKRFDPMDLITQNGKYGPDAFRYFVMREMALGEDSEITAEHFAARYNSELADDFGNLVARFLNMCSRYAGGCVPKVSLPLPEAQHLRVEWETMVTQIESLAKNLGENPNALLLHDFSSMLSGINTFVKSLNRALETIAPWKLAKSNDENDKAKLESCLAVLAEGIRVVATAYTPVMPTISAKVLQCLDQPPVENWREKLRWDPNYYCLTGARLGDKVILFPKIESEEAKEKRKQTE